ncbi:MAG: hypothetical protein MRY21_01805 [Simkaniaceae bacterium]|nr:hypothetical protein [Simkaniaceae bacterium]
MTTVQLNFNSTGLNLPHIESTGEFDMSVGWDWIPTFFCAAVKFKLGLTIPPLATAVSRIIDIELKDRRGFAMLSKATTLFCSGYAAFNSGAALLAGTVMSVYFQVRGDLDEMIEEAVEIYL